MQRPDRCSFNTVSRSRYRWLGPCPFNTIPRFRYGASLRGLHSNDFPRGFISIEMAKIVVASPNLIQPLLLYSDLGPAMLDNICGVACWSSIFSFLTPTDDVNADAYIINVYYNAIKWLHFLDKVYCYSLQQHVWFWLKTALEQMSHTVFTFTNQQLIPCHWNRVKIVIYIPYLVACKF
jgi:hypothetical protein